MEWWQGRALKTVWIVAALAAVVIMILTISLAAGDPTATSTATPSIVLSEPATSIASIATPMTTPTATSTQLLASVTTATVTPPAPTPTPSPSVATPSPPAATPAGATPPPQPTPQPQSNGNQVAEHQTPSEPSSQPAEASNSNEAASSEEETGPTGFAGGIIPIRLLIDTPRMQVDAYVEQLGLTPENVMEAPAGWWDAGWYKLGYQPGQQGNAVIAGHLDSYTGPAVFWHLKDLQPGDIITVVGTQGERLNFRVTGQQSFNDAPAPIEAIFGPSDGRHLNLITCDGIWDSAAGAYTKRLVVFADLIES